jgi:broad specificity phosphatase PhoE
MKELEVRRHAFTKKGAAKGKGSTLSPEGVRLARQVGAEMGPFAYVVASLVPRTLETALAMGFAVDELIEMGRGGWEEATAEIAQQPLRSDDDLYLKYVDRFPAGGAVAEVGRQQAAIWEYAMSRTGDGQAALVVSHGGLIEPALVAALPPDWDHSRWGRGFQQCEGVRLTWNGRFTDARPLRLRA